MRRRQFIAGVIGAAVASPPWEVRAQQADRVRRVGVLMFATPDDPLGNMELTAFRQGLDELGWADGRNINIHLRWTGADLDRARAFAKELVDLKPDVLIACGHNLQSTDRPVRPIVLELGAIGGAHPFDSQRGPADPEPV
jgi:putative ABC transport system substrate-binding protein